MNKESVCGSNYNKLCVKAILRHLFRLEFVVNGGEVFFYMCVRTQARQRNMATVTAITERNTIHKIRLATKLGYQPV